MSRIVFAILLFLTFYNCCFAIEKDNKSDYGLLIRSMPSSNSEKTTLILENHSPLKLGAETTMSFDMLVRNEYRFGIVFRIITNKNENIDLILSVSHVELIVNEQAYIIPQEIAIDRWIPMSLTISKTKKELRLSCDTTTITIPYNISNATGVKISFGSSVFESFVSTDIASVNIRDIRILSNGKLKRYWKLKEHRQDYVLDSIANVPAIAINPQWIIDIYSSWKKIYSDKVPFKTQIAFDGKNTFYIVAPDSKTIYRFESTENRIDSIKVQSGYMASNSPNTIFFDSVANKLRTYNLLDVAISDYSFETNTWSSQKAFTGDSYSNNSAVFLCHDQAFYSFGGYGYYKYDNDLIRMSLTDGSMEKTKLPEILPRFSTATTIVDETMYIFGGRGSKTGRQEISPRNYYDFYSVDLNTKEVVKLWEETEVNEDFFPCTNMIYDRDHNCFYVFTTQKGGTLFQIETGKKGLQQMSLPINESIEAHYLYTNLYFSETQQKFYAVIYKQQASIETDISIYSLDYPPVLIDGLKQVETKQSNLSISKMIITAFALLLFSMMCILLIKRRGLRKNKQTEDIATEPKTTLNNQETNYYDFSVSSVSLLNEFNVIGIIPYIIVYTKKNNNPLQDAFNILSIIST